MTKSQRLGRLAVLALCAIGAYAVAQQGITPPEFNDEERFALVRFWNAPGRYTTEPIVDPKGPVKVRLTPEASFWLWTYNKQRGIAKLPPGQTPAPANPQQQIWERWIEARVAYDRYLAGVEAARLNGNPEPAEVLPPEACPVDLVEFMGEPPKFAAAVRPNRHQIDFDDMSLVYTDNVEMRPRYAYYRFAEGVMSGGQSIKLMPPDELTGLLTKAGISGSEARIFKAVSILEGGFDSVNTYDTGFVSVGFIQFATLKDGAHSLGQAILRMKGDSPEEFAQDFRAFGIDVGPDGSLVTVHPKTGEICRGPLANAAIIEDKRLIAVFARAGRREPFRVAQLRTAKAMYYPAETPLTLKVDGRIITGKLKDVVRSEAGMAVMMDRKVNTGNLGPLVPKLTELARIHNAATLSDLALYEREIITSLVYRVNTLKNPMLTQPVLRR